MIAAVTRLGVTIISTVEIEEDFTSGEPWEDTFPLRGKDGVYRWFLSRALPIRDQSGNVVRWFGTNTDVTAQREMANQIAQQARVSFCTRPLVANPAIQTMVR